MIDKEQLRKVFEEAMETHELEFEKFFLIKMLQLSFTYTDEECHVSLPVQPQWFNPIKSLHGGVIAACMDMSMGHLIHHVTGAGASTIEMKVQYLRPATQGVVRFQGRFIKKGRSVSFLESRAYDENGKVVAAATSTWKMP